MRNNKSFFTVLALSIGFGLTACAKSEDAASQDNALSMEAHPSKLVGSLVKSDINSPEAFAKEVINERENFKAETQTIGQETDQFINNTDGSFTSVVFWEDSDQGMVAKGIAVSIAQPMTPDNAQVLKRMALRLNDSKTVENAIGQHANFTSLSNGAGITIKDLEGRKHYEIY